MRIVGCVQSPFMKMYTQYTNNYESAVVMLEQSANDKDVLHQFIQRCYGGRADVLTFDSYLIMPIQRCLVTHCPCRLTTTRRILMLSLLPLVPQRRIPRYNLLLEVP
jgi:hypothetical protein